MLSEFVITIPVRVILCGFQPSVPLFVTQLQVDLFKLFITPACNPASNSTDVDTFTSINNIYS
jgi:hypothetical protein